MLSTKAKTISKVLPERHFVIGPDFENHDQINTDFLEDKNLPSKEEALFDLANGNFEKVVMFLEKAMGVHLDKADIMSDGPLKQSNYMEASNYSVA